MSSPLDDALDALIRIYRRAREVDAPFEEYPSREQSICSDAMFTALAALKKILPVCRCGHLKMDHSEGSPANPRFCSWSIGRECDCDEYEEASNGSQKEEEAAGC